MDLIDTMDSEGGAGCCLIEGATICPSLSLIFLVDRSFICVALLGEFAKLAVSGRPAEGTLGGSALSWTVREIISCDGVPFPAMKDRPAGFSAGAMGVGGSVLSGVPWGRSFIFSLR